MVLCEALLGEEEVLTTGETEDEPRPQYAGEDEKRWCMGVPENCSVILRGSAGDLGKRVECGVCVCACEGGDGKNEDCGDVHARMRRASAATIDVSERWRRCLEDASKGESVCRDEVGKRVYAPQSLLSCATVSAKEWEGGEMKVSCCWMSYMSSLRAAGWAMVWGGEGECQRRGREKTEG